LECPQPLASLLCARAIIETAAFFDNFDTDLSKLCEQEDFSGIDKLVMKHAFATRLKDLSWGTEAVNILTLIGKLDKRLGKKDDGVLRHYEFISEFCHPNSYGHTQFFQMIDEETATINLSDKSVPEKSLFGFICGGFFLIGLIEISLNNIEKFLLPKVLELSEAARRK
jgi:hypothetical protein